MTFPHEKEVRGAVLRVLTDLGGEARPQDVYPRVTARFPQLTPDDLSQTLKYGENAWTARIGFARLALVIAGEVDKSTRGVWRITGKGRERIGGGDGDSTTTHERIVAMVKEIGERLGRVVTTSEGPVYRHDVLWRRNPFQSPAEVIEICDSGNLEKDILSLQWATGPDIWGAVGFLVVLDEKELERARKRLGPQQRIYLLSGEFMRQLHAIVTDDKVPFLRAIFG